MTEEILTASIGILFGAFLGWVTTQYFDWRRQKDQQKRRANVLFGELRNIKHHYTVSANMIPVQSNLPDQKLALELCKYGGIAAIHSNIEQYGFLSEINIERITRLHFLIRNTDTVLDHIIGNSIHLDGKYKSGSMKQHLEFRMKIISATAGDVISQMKPLFPNFSPLKELEI